MKAYYLEWQIKYPEYIIIGKEKEYYSARGKSALILEASIGYKVKYTKNGKAYITTKNLNILLNKLDEKNLSYIVFNGSKEIIRKTDGANAFDNYPTINSLGLSESFCSVYQTINALEDGINPISGEFYSDEDFLLSEMAKQILSLARKGLLFYSQNGDDDTKCFAKVKKPALKNDATNPKKVLSTYEQYLKMLADYGLTNAYSSWNEDEDDQLLLEYNNGEKIVSISKKHKRTPTAIIKRLEKHGIDVKERHKKHNQPFINQKVEKEFVETVYKAEECYLYKQNNCGGMSCDTCNDFIKAYTISKDEIEMWPKYGDASAIRLNDRSRFE